MRARQPFLSISSLIQVVRPEANACLIAPRNCRTELLVFRRNIPSHGCAPRHMCVAKCALFVTNGRFVVTFVAPPCHPSLHPLTHPPACLSTIPTLSFHHPLNRSLLLVFPISAASVDTEPAITVSADSSGVTFDSCSFYSIDSGMCVIQVSSRSATLVTVCSTERNRPKTAYLNLCAFCQPRDYREA